MRAFMEKSDADTFYEDAVSEMQELLWTNFFSKYSPKDFDIEKRKSNSNQSFQNHSTIQKPIIGDVPTENINSAQTKFDRNILNSVRQIIEIDLKSDLKHYCIKLLSSFIRRDKKIFYWINSLKKELKNISRKLHMEYIKMYIANIIPLPSKEMLFHLFENELHCKLKYYIVLRKLVPNEQESFNVLIQDEWNRMRKEGVSEKFICLYWFILAGGKR